MKAHYEKPLEQRGLEKETINLLIAIGVLSEEFGFGEKRCMRFVNAFYDSVSEFNRIAKKEGLFSAKALLENDMKQIFPEWDGMLHAGKDAGK